MSEQRSSLLLVEGLPGAGKSSTAQWLADRIGWHWFYEHATRHPLYDPQWLQGCLASGDYPDDLADRLLAGWQRLVALGQPAVIEGGLLQSGVAPQLLAGVGQEQIEAWFARVAERILPLAPVIVMLLDPDPPRALERVCRARAPWFEPLLLQRIGHSPWARQRRLRPAAAIQRFYMEYQALCHHLLQRWPGESLQLVSDGEWLRINCTIADWLGLDPPTPASLTPSQLARLAGHYGDNCAHPLVKLVIRESALWLRGEGADDALLPLAADRLRVRGIDLEFRFGGERGGRFQWLQASGDLEGLPVRWVRTTAGQEVACR